MRISDWSSDVCSSDLTEAHLRLRRIADAEIARDELAAVIVQHRPGAAVRAAGGRGFLPAHQLVLADDGPVALHPAVARRPGARSEEHTSELQSLMRISYAVFCLKQKKPHAKSKKTNAT